MIIDINDLQLPEAKRRELGGWMAFITCMYKKAQKIIGNPDLTARQAQIMKRAAVLAANAIEQNYNDLCIEYAAGTGKEPDSGKTEDEIFNEGYMSALSCYTRTTHYLLQNKLPEKDVPVANQLYMVMGTDLAKAMTRKIKRSREKA